MTQGTRDRFYDFFEKRDGRWGLVLRQPIYEKDRMDRHLAYLQAGIGYQVKLDMPDLTGAEAETLYACGREWLAGRPL